MKIYNAAILVASLLSGIGSVLANDNGERGDRAESQQHRDVRTEQRQPERSATTDRPVEADNNRRAAERSNPADQNKHANHLSAEERRALRQQINEAGQDIYNRQR